MPKFVSWLERAINEFPQAKASAQQWMAGLKKSPLVNMNEVEDRGLDEFLTGEYNPGTGSITREQIQGWLGEQGMPVGERFDSGMDKYEDYATPGMKYYHETLTANPASESRALSPHFEDTEGYKFHERGGVIPQSNFGKAQVLDEIQTDIKRPDWKERWDPNITGVEGDSTKWFAGEYDIPTRNLEDSGLLPAGRLTDRAVLHPGWDRQNTPEEAANAIEDIRSYLTDSNVDGDVSDLLQDLEQIESLNRAPKGSHNVNLPGRDSWQWQGMAGALSDAVDSGADSLAWPSSDEQFRRYFQRSPEHYEQVLAMEPVELAQAAGDPRRVQRIGSEAADARQALGSLNMYKNQYDKKMPRNRRWKQLGLEPKLVDFKNMRPRGWSESSPGDGSRALGKYWVVELTPETKARLKESGIPYYMVGGAAVIGQEEEDGALD